MAVLLGRGGNPSILIRKQGHIVQGYAVAAGIQSQCLRAGLLLVTVDVLHGQVLKEYIVGVNHYRSTNADVHGIVTTAEAVVLDDGLVAILTYEIEVGFCLGYVNMLFVFTILNEDEPWCSALGRGSIDGSLHGGIYSTCKTGWHITCCINDGIVDTCLRLLALHGGECNCGWGHGIAAA